VEKGVEGSSVAGHDFGIILRNRRREVEAKHPTDILGTEGQTQLLANGIKACAKLSGFFYELFKKTSFPNDLQGGQPCGNRERVA